MSEKIESSVLRRKAQIGQEQFQARAMTAARALRVALAKVAQDEIGLALAAIGLTEARGPAEPVLKSLDETTLLILLESPGRGPGAVLIDSALAGAIVQQQTMGQVGALREGVPLRKPTRTDAALAAPLLDALFARAGPMPDLAWQMQMLSGLRFGADIATTRLLGMALDADEYVHFAITVDIANGTRQGRIELLLPLPDIQAEPPMSDTDEDGAPPPSTLEPMVMSLSAQLRVALCRIRMPFSQLADMAPGDTLPVPEGAMNSAEVLTIAGRPVARGKIGQIDGLRALRLTAGDKTGARPATERAAAATGSWQTDRAGHGSTSGMDVPPPHAASGLAELDGSPDDTLGNLPEIPDLPELPELPGEETGALPDLPELPELPELSDLPASSGVDPQDLPDFPDLPELSMAQQG